MSIEKREASARRREANAGRREALMGGSEAAADNRSLLTDDRGEVMGYHEARAPGQHEGSGAHRVSGKPGRPGREAAGVSREGSRAHRESRVTLREARAMEPTEVQPPNDPDVLRREIAETRDDLADALTSLAERTNVKVWLREEIAYRRARAIEQMRDRRGVIGAGLAAALAGAATIIAIRRRRARMAQQRARAIAENRMWALTGRRARWMERGARWMERAAGRAREDEMWARVGQARVRANARADERRGRLRAQRW